ncbi:hypothetical protein PAECIP111893_00292 [Paenibacillus plantiphilus]|uniref:Uncharacterized protein n=1 Tax=Paenibacillus plantiphilus TaxID=2905650 RepID=A0ABN8FXC6_9BACL|nr:hypothetical protein [Paenibacillus plantiphilus]CAH1190358.1 hypothetical protein PAECIP111893_00292 [Paenibacillus plantiphilus]
MLQQALQKIQQEVGANPKEEYIRLVGAELINYVRSNPEKAQLFLADGKTIGASKNALEQEAKKKNARMLHPDEARIIILSYFGIEPPKTEPEPVAVGFAINLDDLGL